jgi:hypothetical protein
MRCKAGVGESIAMDSPTCSVKPLSQFELTFAIELTFVMRQAVHFWWGSNKAIGLSGVSWSRSMFFTKLQVPLKAVEQELAGWLPP